MRRIPAFFAAILGVLWLAVATAAAGELAGQVVAIANGDSFTLLTADKGQIKVRLAEIDAPEDGQPFGKPARQMLAGLIFGKDMIARQISTDLYGGWSPGSSVPIWT